MKKFNKQRKIFFQEWLIVLFVTVTCEVGATGRRPDLSEVMVNVFTGRPGFYGMVELGDWWLADGVRGRANGIPLLYVWSAHQWWASKHPPLLHSSKIYPLSTHTHQRSTPPAPSAPTFSPVGLLESTVLRDYNPQDWATMPRGLGSVRRSTADLLHKTQRILYLDFAATLLYVHDLLCEAGGRGGGSVSNLMETRRLRHGEKQKALVSTLWNLIGLCRWSHYGEKEPDTRICPYQVQHAGQTAFAGFKNLIYCV